MQNGWDDRNKSTFSDETRIERRSNKNLSRLQESETTHIQGVNNEVTGKVKTFPRCTEANIQTRESHAKYYQYTVTSVKRFFCFKTKYLDWFMWGGWKLL